MNKFLFLFLLFSGLNVFAQNKTHSDLMEDFLNQRQKMMESVFKAFDDDDFFKDDVFPDTGISGFAQGMPSMGGQIKIDQKEESDGSISIMITPENEGMSLDIDTKDDFITIKSETKIIDKKDQNGNTFQSQSISRSSRSISIPPGYKAKTPEAVGKSIKISLVPDEDIKKLPSPGHKNGRVPIMKSPGDETI